MGNDESKGQRLGGDSAAAGNSVGGRAAPSGYSNVSSTVDPDLAKALQISAAEARLVGSEQRGKPKISEEQRIAAEVAEKQRMKELKAQVNQGSRLWESEDEIQARLGAAAALEARLTKGGRKGITTDKGPVILSAKVEKSLDLAFAVQEKKLAAAAQQVEQVYGLSRGGSSAPPSSVLSSESSAYEQSTSSDREFSPSLDDGNSDPSLVPIPALELAMQTLQSRNSAGVWEASLKTLRTILDNVAKAKSLEEDAKFRKIKYNHKAVQKNIVQVPGAVDCLQAVGFQFVELVENDEAPEQYLVLPPSVDNRSVRQALHWLSM